jgi:hypothetical protein
VRRAGVGLALAVMLSTPSARADPSSVTFRYSPYEEQAIRDAASDLGTSVDPQPEGKIVERIDFVRLDPIDRHDPAPMTIDVLHVTSRPSVLRHEIFVREGDAWRKTMVDESARSLRLLPQLSLVICVPMRGSSPDRVRLVVITKDVWSLYPDFDLEATSGGIELFDLEPKETNVAGLHHTALARFILRPLSYSIGASYEVPRLDGRWLDLLVDGNVELNRATGNAEGSFGSASITRPLYSSLTRWAWSSGVVWSDRIERRYVNAAVATFTPPNGAPVAWEWRARTIAEEARVTRSFGWETKNDVSIGASFSRGAYHTGASLDPASASAFQRAAVPVGEDRVGPYLQWHGYTSNFLRVLDVDTLGLQEDVRLGHDLWLRVYPILRALGSTRDVYGTYAAARYTLPLGDGVASASIESTIEAEPERISDASVKAAAAIVTPRIGVGRFVFGVTALNRWRNHLNAQSLLGGESLLRGYPSRYATGKDMFATNLEYRSRPIEIASIQLGLGAFYDVGNAFNGFDHIAPLHSVGVGARVVLPQIERAVFRFDVGFPITGGALPPGVSPVSFILAFHQALGLPSVGAGRGQ